MGDCSGPIFDKIRKMKSEEKQKNSFTDLIESLIIIGEISTKIFAEGLSNNTIPIMYLRKFRTKANSSVNQDLENIFDNQIDLALNAISELEEKYTTEVPAIDAAAQVLFKTSPEMAREFITNYSVNMGDYTVQRYKELGQFLLVKYIDRNIKKEENGEFLRSPEGYPLFPDQPGYSEQWYDMVVKDAGKKLRMPKSEAH